MLGRPIGTESRPTGVPEASRRGEGGFWTVFGTATLPTSTSVPPPRGEGGFWQVFGTATLPTGAPGASQRGETVISPTSLRLVTFTEQAHHAHRPLRGRLPCAVEPIGPHRANDYALHLP